MRIRVFQLQLLVIACAAVASSACATIVSSNTDTVRLHTEPAYAKAIVDHQAEHGANSTVKLDRSHKHTIEFRKEGYESKSVVVDTELNWWFFGNLLFGPGFWIGMIVDGVSGAVMQLDTKDIRVTLTPLPGTKPEAPIATKPPVNPPANPGSNQTPSASTVADRSWIVAVMPVEIDRDAKLSSGLSSALTDQIRVFFGERRVRVVDRGSQQAVLDQIVEEEKKKSYAACVDVSCQIPLGKALAASHILRTNVARFGKLCTTNAELVDLTTEVTVSAGSARSDCSEEGMLDAAEKLVNQILGAGS